MSPIATILLQMGHRVSGSDIAATEVTERLIAAGAAVTIGHRPDNLPADTSLVIASTAIPADNIELEEARRRGIGVVDRAPVLAAMARQRRTVSVAGTHGKTTTSSMLAVMARSAGTSPSFLIGGVVRELATNAEWADGEWFVLEADESDGSGFAAPHEIAVVTNIEPDHLEYHGSVENLHRAFSQFLSDASGVRIVCADDPVAARLGTQTDALTFGTGESAEYRMLDLRSDRTGCRFTLRIGNEDRADVRLTLPGEHNARNACAAIAAAIEMGVDLDAAVAAIGSFDGVGRRFEHRGRIHGIEFVDDYAHLPTEIAAAVAAGRDGDWGRVVAVFQPHRYSRTDALWSEFATSFVGADLLVVTDVYAAGERPRPGVTGRLIVDAVLGHDPAQAVVWFPDRAGLAGFLAEELRPGDLCLTLGAGDLTALPDEVQALIAARNSGDRRP